MGWCFGTIFHTVYSPGDLCGNVRRTEKKMQLLIIRLRKKVVQSLIISKKEKPRSESWGMCRLYTVEEIKCE